MNLITLLKDAVLNLGSPVQETSDNVDTSKTTYDGNVMLRGSMFYVTQDATLNLYGGTTIQAAGTEDFLQGGAITVEGDESHHPELNMYGGQIKDCASFCYAWAFSYFYGGGGAVQLIDNASFTMQGGIIQDCQSYLGGAVALNSNIDNFLPCTFTLIDGQIIDNLAGVTGGAVFVGVESTFNMQGGVIAGNQASYGGGISVGVFDATDHAEAHISGGLIQGNGSYNGGGIYNEGNNIVITGGTISNNEAWILEGEPESGEGGGIYNYGVLVIQGGTITHNSAGRGGGIFNEEYLYIGGGFIFDNSAEYAGDDITSSQFSQVGETDSDSWKSDDGSLTLTIESEGRTLNPDFTLFGANQSVVITPETAELNGWVFDGPEQRFSSQDSTIITDAHFVNGQIYDIKATRVPSVQDPDPTPEPPKQDPDPTPETSKDNPLPDTGDDDKNTPEANPTPDSEPDAASDPVPATTKRLLPRTGSGQELPSTGDTAVLVGLFIGGGLVALAAAALLAPKRIFGRK